MIDARQRNTALLVAGCFFMENLDGTIVTTAAPRIAADLHVPSTAVGLVISAYLITLAILIPLGGWMTGRFGTRRVFLAAIAGFTLASGLCATSVNLYELVGMRVLQGAAGAMMVPVGRLVVLSRVAKSDMLRAIAFIVWPALTAPVIAPFVGGLIVTHASWRWLFVINLPIGVIAFIVALRVIPSIRPDVPRQLDWGGLLLTCGGLGALVYTANLLGERDASWALVGVGFSVAVVLIVPTPLLDLRVARLRSLRDSLVGMSLFAMVVMGLPFLLPLLFENVFHWTPVKSGEIVLLVFVGNIAIKPATTRMLNRFGFRTVVICATSGVAATVVVFGLLAASTPIALIVIVTILSGVFRSIGFTSYMSLGFSDVPADRMRDANTLAATVQQLGAGIAIAAATDAIRLGGAFGRVVLSRYGTGTSYSIAFEIMAVVMLVGTAAATRMAADAGHAITTARQPAKAEEQVD
jgi:EmrB/QacA subfamily drug resistance transporter